MAKEEKIENEKEYEKPKEQNKFNKKIARAMVKSLFNIYPIEVIEKIRESSDEDNL